MPKLNQKIQSRKLIFAVFTWIIGTIYLLLVFPETANDVGLYKEWIDFTKFILASYFGANVISHGINSFSNNYKYENNPPDNTNN